MIHDGDADGHRRRTSPQAARPRRNETTSRGRRRHDRRAGHRRLAAARRLAGGVAGGVALQAGRWGGNARALHHRSVAARRPLHRRRRSRGRFPSGGMCGVGRAAGTAAALAAAIPARRTVGARTGAGMFGDRLGALLAGPPRTGRVSPTATRGGARRRRRSHHPADRTRRRTVLRPYAVARRTATERCRKTVAGGIPSGARRLWAGRGIGTR